MLFYVVVAKFHWNLLRIMLADFCMFFLNEDFGSL